MQFVEETTNKQTHKSLHSEQDWWVPLSQWGNQGRRDVSFVNLPRVERIGRS